MKAKKKVVKIDVDAPSGYHWMNEGGRYFLMKHDGDFVPHEGASLKASFRVKRTHS